MEPGRPPGGRWRVRVDADACIGSGICAASVPERFRLDGPTAEPVTAEVDPDDAVLAAAEMCPAAAIEVTPET